MLEAAASAIQAKAKRAEGAANSSSWLPLFGLWTCRRCTGTSRVDGTSFKLSTFNMHEVTSGAKRTHSKGSESAARNVFLAAYALPLLLRAVHKQTATAIVAVASGVIAAAQLSLVLGVSKGHMEFMNAMSKLTALSKLAGARGRIGSAEFSLVASGADKWGERRGR